MAKATKRAGKAEQRPGEQTAKEDSTKRKPFTKVSVAQTELNLNLLNNGIDFVQSGVRYFLHDDPKPSSHKYAILHLFSGFLLLLKERLKREHPSLIFKDVRDVSKPNGKTIDFDEALSRLEHCARVKLEDKALKVLRTAQGLRNRAEHYEFVIELKEAQAVIGDLSELVYTFLRDELNVSLHRHVESQVWDRMQYLQGISQRLEADRAKNWRSRAGKYADLDDEELQELAESIGSYHPKHNPDPDTFLECPECGEDAVVVQAEDVDMGVCTNLECREMCEITSCLRCDRSLTDGSQLCETCSEYIDNQ